MALYNKPTSTNEYLHAQSHHPIRIKTSFIKSELDRILLHSTTYSDFVKSKELFYTNLINRTYTPEFLTPIFDIHEPPALICNFECIVGTPYPNRYAQPRNNFIHAYTRNQLISHRLLEKDLPASKKQT